MEKKKQKQIVFISALLGICSAVLLFLLLGPDNITRETVGGNIAMSEFYTDNTSPNFKIFENKVNADRDFRQSTMFSLSYVDSHVSELLSNAKLSLEAMEDLPVGDAFYDEMDKTRAFAEATLIRTSRAVDAYTLIINGRSNVNYEKCANEALVSLLLIDKCNKTGERFVKYADSIINAEGLENRQKLAFARDQWSLYMAMEKFLESEKKTGLSPDKKTIDLLLSPVQTRTQFKTCTSGIRNSILSATAMDSFLAGNYCGLQDRLKVIYESASANVGRHSICLTEGQLNQVNLNATGWIVFVMEDGSVSKTCILTDKAIIKKSSNKESNLSLAIKDSHPFVLNRQYDMKDFRESIDIVI